jgi:Spy/CpxP family protein refolding chaperone
MKIHLLIIALLLSISTGALSQRPEGAGGSRPDDVGGTRPDGAGTGGSQISNIIYSQLDLSEEQRTQFDAVMQTRTENVQVAMEVIHAEIRSQLSEFLTTEQLDKLDIIQQVVRQLGRRH